MASKLIPIAASIEAVGESLAETIALLRDHAGTGRPLPAAALGQLADALGPLGQALTALTRLARLNEVKSTRKRRGSSPKMQDTGHECAGVSETCDA
jgi:hypothetical protein